MQPYREGGLNEFVHKLPGPTLYPSNLILKRGLTDIQMLWAWHQDVIRGTIIRRNGSIYLLGRESQPVLWWNFTGAYPVKWVGPELRAESNTVAVETVELVHRGLSRPQSGSVPGVVPGPVGAKVNATFNL